MGGSAFPDTERLSESDYSKVVAEVLGVVGSKGVTIGAPVQAQDKAKLCRAQGKDKPYGDVDFIVGSTSEVEIVDLVREFLGTPLESRTLKNDNTYSFLTKEMHQVDLKFCKEENFQFLLAIKLNNDFGILIGHLLTPLKLKWSEEGLSLRLAVYTVPGVGTKKKDFLLTNNLEHVCEFLGLPVTSLDGAKSLSSQQIFEILTTSRMFFDQVYDKKYKTQQRRKKCPISAAVFNLLEGRGEELEAKKRARFDGDQVEALFHEFRKGSITFVEYAHKVSDYFNKEQMVLNALEEMEKAIQGNAHANERFNFCSAQQWLPEFEARRVGKVLQHIKSSHSGQAKEAYAEWLALTLLELIRAEVETVAAMLSIQDKKKFRGKKSS